MEHDVIVAGAGPAGSTVGHELARKGYSVLILEKRSFPRDKLCAGGLPRRVLKYIDIQDGQVIEDRIHRVEFSWRPKERFVLRSDSPLMYTVQRRHFDHFLLRRAQAAGCQVLESQPVQRWEVTAGKVRVRTPGGEHIGRILVGADGVAGAVSRARGFTHRRRIIATLQSEVPLNGETAREYKGRVWIGFGWVPHGYAWIFPKGDHLAVGMGVMIRGRHAGSLKLSYRQLLRYLFPEHLQVPTSSYPIALWDPGQKLVLGPVLLVGEAGSLVHPITAEGIYYAIKSARLAGEAVDNFLSGAAPDLQSYQRRVHEEMGRFFRTSWLFSGLFYGLPRLSFRLFVNNNRYMRRYFGSDVEVAHRS